MLGEKVFNQLRIRRHFQHFLRFVEQTFVAGRNRRFKATASLIVDANLAGNAVSKQMVFTPGIRSFIAALIPSAVCGSTRKHTDPKLA